jgi:hypothetical protein
MFRTTPGGTWEWLPNSFMLTNNHPAGMLTTNLMLSTNVPGIQVCLLKSPIVYSKHTWMPASNGNGICHSVYMRVLRHGIPVAPEKSSRSELIPARASPAAHPGTAGS